MPVVDLAKQQGQEKFLQKALAKFGLPTSINDAIDALAGTIRDHAHFGRLLTSIGPEDRQMFYDGVRTRLKFEAKPLAAYVYEAQNMAEREQLPVIQQDGTLHAFQVPSIVTDENKAVENMLAKAAAMRTLTVTCHTCLSNEQFYGMEGETPVAVIMKARRAGWNYTPVVETETCPACMAKVTVVH